LIRHQKMLNPMNSLNKSDLLQWIKNSLRTRSNILAHGNQGHVYLYEVKGHRLIVKTPTGWGLGKYIRRVMLRNEYRAYSRLSGVSGVPSCYGLLDGRYLVLECIDGIPARKAPIEDRAMFFESLLRLIKELHKAGVAHGDLKKKDNVFVVNARTPYILDFGVAIVKKPGFGPLNHYLYDLERQFDLNAWVKLKYKGKVKKVSDEDRAHYHRTAVEKVSGWIKRGYLKLKKRAKVERHVYGSL